MWKRTACILLKVESQQEARAVPRSTFARKRRFTTTNRLNHSSSHIPKERGRSHAFIPVAYGGNRLTSVTRDGQLTPDFDAAGFSSSTGQPRQSQRQRFRLSRAQEEEAQDSDLRGVAASSLMPLPRKYGFYDGIDEHGVEALRPSKDVRREMLRQSLESQAASVVEFTDGGEADIELNGLPANEYHGQRGWTTIPKESSLFNTVYARGELESRQRMNSWGLPRRKTELANTRLQVCAAEEKLAPPQKDADEGHMDKLDDARRRRRQSNGDYSDELEGELLEPSAGSVGLPRSTYGLRKLFVSGLTGYQGIVSRSEEAQMCEELLQLLQDSRAAYIAEETRYCINLYENELGLPGRDTLAFAMHRAPTLQRVLRRFFDWGLIPTIPNVCQVNEMIGTSSGYPVHRKPRSIGSYYGILNLVSTSVVYLQHVDCPWYPRLHANPRSLFVVREPCLSEYKIGYKQTHQPFHSFEYATRVSKDYRIEVLFATVETDHTKYLVDAVKLTEYAAQQLGGEKLIERVDNGMPPSQPGVHCSDAGGNTWSMQTDQWLEKLRHTLHHSEAASACGSERLPEMDGHTLRRQLLERGVVGSRPHSLESDGSSSHGATPGQANMPSTAQRRMAALKARHELTMRIRSNLQSVQRCDDGPRLIRGHAPGDRREV